MKNLVAVGMLLLSASSFAQQTPEKKYICQAAHFLLNQTIQNYIPADTTSCKNNDECTFRQMVRWKRPEGMNKRTLAVYHLIYQDTQVRYYHMQIFENCTKKHPKLVFPEPSSVECVANVCTPQFNNGSARLAQEVDL